MTDVMYHTVISGSCLRNRGYVSNRDVLSLPHVNDFAMSESGNISLNSSEIPSLEFNEWCLTAVFKHHRASARSVGVALSWQKVTGCQKEPG